MIFFIILAYINNLFNTKLKEHRKNCLSLVQNLKIT